jgi:drug/metabolite transporter (DMT)-like permease
MEMPVGTANAGLMITVLRMAEAGPFLPRGVSVRRLLWLGGGIAGFVTFFNFGIIYSDTVTAITIMAAGPVVAIWFGATPRIEQLLGGALIASAVVWVQTRRKAVLAFTDKPR